MTYLELAVHFCLLESLDPEVSHEVGTAAEGIAVLAVCTAPIALVADLSEFRTAVITVRAQLLVYLVHFGHLRTEIVNWQWLLTGVDVEAEDFLGLFLDTSYFAWIFA